MFKQNKAITLISLIVTVVVLLILAGVSINFMFGQEGIFSRTQYAIQKYKNQQNEEETQIAKYENIIKQYEAITSNREGTSRKVSLWKGNSNTTPEIKLLETWDNFDFLLFRCMSTSNQDNQTEYIISKETIQTAYDTYLEEKTDTGKKAIKIGYDNDGSYIDLNVKGKLDIKHKNGLYRHIVEIIGIKL